MEPFVDFARRRAAVFLLALFASSCGALVREPPGPDEPAAHGASVMPAAQRVPAEALVEQLRTRLSLPVGALRVQTRADGTTRTALDGHLQHATIAVIGDDGVLRTRCVDSPAAAARAFGVDAAASSRPTP